MNLKVLTQLIVLKLAPTSMSVIKEGNAAFH